VPPIRIALTGLPTMLRELIRRLIADDAGLELVGWSDDPDLRSALDTGADVVVFGSGTTTEHQAVEALCDRCMVRLIGITTDGASATLFEMRPYRELLGELGAVPLAAVLRGGAAR
jgi:hypothetical protein